MSQDPAPTGDALEVLLATPGHRESLRHLAELPAREGKRAPWPAWAAPALVEAYRARGVSEPWVHQVEAADHVHAGRHTVLATGTGSGKSLAAWLPALSAILAGTERGGSLARMRRRPTVLYLSPTKALAADQLSALHELLGAGGLRSDLRAATCDGDTAPEERDWVRAHADVVLTNPDFLHFSLLPGHERWDRMLRGLRYIVIDECHAYRGVLGAHVALVLRRLLRVARHMGADPVVIAASATTGEPAATLARLIAVPVGEVAAVTRDTAPQGRRRIALWEPAPLEGVGDLDAPQAAGHDGADDPWAALTGVPDDVPRRSATTESAELLTDLVAAGRRTLAFVRSRVGVETVAALTAETLRERDEERTTAPGLAGVPGVTGAVAAYRGGYLPEERRALERGLRRGDLLGLATTNALELGVDVSGLDAVLISGWPGTRVSFWQQAGRAGRAGADGVAVLIASANPLDTYLVHHPEAILEEAVEATTFDPTNTYVLGPHLCAAAAEVPLTEADLPLFDLPDATLLDALTARGLLRRRPAGWFWNHARPERPSQLTSLRGSTNAGVQIVEGETGAVLGTVDGGRADAVVHPGAVYVHQGTTFVVDDLDEHAALVHRDAVEHRTMATVDHHASLLGVNRRAQWGPVTWATGPVEVTSQVTGFDVRRPPSMEILGSHPLEMPVRTLPTRGVWWSAPDDVLREETGLAPGDLPGALHAAEHAAIGVLPLLATCDRWDIGGLSTALHPDTGMPTVIVHDGYPGGAGFAERGFEAAARWIEATFGAIASCPCANGCPRCVYSPKCGNGNSPLDKAGALAVLRFLREVAPR